MKKALLSFGLIALMLAPVFGQDLEVSESASDGKLMTKRGAPILPEAGDWGIGLDASPFLDYVGNAFNGNFANSAPSWNFTAQYPMHIYIRNVRDDETVMRALVRIGFNSESQDVYSGGTLLGKGSTSAFTIGLAAGLEKNKSLSNRIRGYYGAMAGIFFLPYDSAGTVIGNTKFEPDGGGNTVEINGGTTFAIAARAFIGAEYFFAPKMSLGGEFGWGLAFASTSDRKDNSSGTEVITEGKSSQFVLDTDNGTLANIAGFSGQLTFFIYF